MVRLECTMSEIKFLFENTEKVFFLEILQLFRRGCKEINKEGHYIVVILLTESSIEFHDIWVLVFQEILGLKYWFIWINALAINCCLDVLPHYLLLFLQEQKGFVIYFWRHFKRRWSVLLNNFIYCRCHEDHYSSLIRQVVAYLYSILISLFLLCKKSH